MAHGLTQKIAARALLEIGHSERQIAKHLKVSPNSVNLWRHDPRFQLIPKEQIERVKETLLGKTYLNANFAQSSITQEKLNQSSALQLATISAICIDKARLMENLSTENVSYRGIMDSIHHSAQVMEEKLKDYGFQ